MPTSRLFHRAELLLGPAALERLARTRVILFGVGGVGSWCAEALVRTGLGHLTLVDSDVVCETNVNRQLPATPQTVGAVKVDVLAARLRDLNPDAEIVARPDVYEFTTRNDFALASFDYVLDAIDSLSNKLGLMHAAAGSGATLFSSMGASARLDPTRVHTASVWDTEGCPLARKVRKRLRRQGFQGDFVCVYSDEEPIPPLVREEPEDRPQGGSTKAVVNGSLVHVTATVGMVLASLVIRDVAARTDRGPEPRPPETP